MQYETIIEINGKDVTFTANVEMEDHGIGSYECHGYKGNHIDWQPTVQGDIDWNKRNFTHEENKVIDAYLENNYETIATLLERKYEPGD